MKQGEAQGIITSFSPLIHPGEMAGDPHEDHHVCSALQVNTAKQESTLSHISSHHPVAAPHWDAGSASHCSAFDSDPGLKLDATLSAPGQESWPHAFLLHIELVSEPSSGGQWWCKSCHPTAEVLDTLVIQVLLNLQWSFILINPF